MPLYQEKITRQTKGKKQLEETKQVSACGSDVAGILKDILRAQGTYFNVLCD